MPCWSSLTESMSNKENHRAIYQRRISRVVESGVGGWGAIMEIVARRKTFVKDKNDQIVEIELSTGPQSALWRSWSWSVWLVLGCVLFISAMLWGQWSSYVIMAKTTVTRNIHQFSKLPAMESEEMGIPIPDPVPSIYVQDVVLFPDNVMLLVRVTKSLNLEGSIDSLECQFGGIPYDSVNKTSSPVISIKPRTKDLQMVRCSLPEDLEFPSQYHNNVTLGISKSEVKVASSAFYHPKHGLPRWDGLVYENLIDSDSMVLLAKGLVTRSQKKIDTGSLKCVFGTDLPNEILYETAVMTAAQEVIRCKKPPASLDEKLRGHRVSILPNWIPVLPSVTYYDPDKHPRSFIESFVNLDFSATADQSNVSLDGDFQSEDDVQVVPAISEAPVEVATFADEEDLVKDPQSKRKLCACTMVWNKAQFIREWVMYHSFLGVEKYFFYDNDSDDNTVEVLENLSADYNVSRMVWPWIKTQQAAFSHCTILAKDECEWMLFTDVDEYIYPSGYLKLQNPELPSDAMVFHRLIERETANAVKSDQTLGQIQFDCHNFGPSGLKSTPKKGVTVGYGCRMKHPLRHKSIIKVDAIDESLLNVLHHFELRKGYYNFRLSRKVAVCNHYKFQAWDAFKMKFVRRAGTYTTDWQKSENQGSKDRTPGLSTKAEKPADWEKRFCEVHDTGLRDFVLRTFVVPGEVNKMIWQTDDVQSAHSDKKEEHQ